MRYRGDKGKAWESVKASVRRREKDCYTCPNKNLTGINAQSGHYMPVAIVGSNNKLSWDSRFIHLQCSRCNGAGQGMQVEFREHLIKDYGEEVVLWFEANRRKVNPVKDWKRVQEHFDSIEPSVTPETS